MANLPAVISPDQRAELADLYGILLIATKRAAEVLRTNGEPLEGLALECFLTTDAKVLAIVTRINEILEVLSAARSTSESPTHGH
jgi:hypothetical protein